MLGANWDVTEEKLREKELERSNKDLGAFAYVASHDLKSPLRGIRQLATWIEEDLDTVPIEISDHIALMKTRINRMENLLDNLLSYSRAGKTESNEVIEAVDTHLFIEELFSFISPPPSFKLRLHGDFPCIQVCKPLLQQVLQNLMGNAIKHRVSDEGELGIWIDQTPEKLYFHVADDGNAIEKAYHDRIFEMFQTLKPRDTVEGSGMGLAIVKRIVQNQGGELGLKTHEPKNSDGYSNEFYFTWPKKSP